MRAIKIALSTIVVGLVAALAIFVILNRAPNSLGAQEATDPPLALDAAEPPLAPAASPEPATDKCQGAGSIIDRAPPTVDLMVHVSTAIFVGTVTEVGPARWNTKDGRAPEGDAFPSDVVRLLRVEVSDQFVGDAGATRVTVWIRGGQIGCSLYWSSDYPADISAGQQFAFFADGAQPAFEIAGTQRVQQMWPIDKDGMIATPEEGPLSRNGFAEAVERAAAPK